MIYNYNDGLQCAGRRPRLYLAKGSEVKKFTGGNIPGYCSIITEQYEKCGKWSNTTYKIELAPGVRPLSFISPMHGKWGDNLASWGEVAENLGIPVEVAQDIVRIEYVKTADRLDQFEKFSLAIEAEGNTTELVVISFGSPSNKSIKAGFWGSPKSSKTSYGKIVTVAPVEEEYGHNWSNPVLIEPKGAKVISSRHTPGMHGGYWAIEVAVSSEDDSYQEEVPDVQNLEHSEPVSVPTKEEPPTIESLNALVERFNPNIKD